MPTSVTYSYVYSTNTYSAGSADFQSPAIPLTQTVTDADGTVDGSTMVGQTLNTGVFGDLTLIGMGGGGVLGYNGSSYLLFTDNSFLSGPVAIDTATTFHYCYLAGTAIRTPGGERAVESLRRGDLVSTHDGRAVPVRWIGTQVRDARVARLSGGMPVRVRRGALGVDATGAPVPLRDLCVSPDHALLVDGLLIHAAALVNGTSITRVRMDELVQVAYFHIETENHEIIVADGAPAETFIDNADRARFDNHAEWLALYPDAPAMRELPLGRVKLARQVPKRVRERLAGIAAGLAVPVADGATRVA